MELNEIKNGENRTLEFKKELPQDSSKWIKTIVAFANGAGGKLNVIEGWGTGLKRIIDFCKEKNVEPPVFEEIGDLLRVNFYRPNYKKSAINDPINDLINDLINDPINLFDLIKQNPSGSYEDYAQKLNVSSATIKRKIAELKAEGKIVRKGSNKKGFWEIES